MSKFKVGDKVRRKFNHIDASYPVTSGQIVTVSEVDHIWIRFQEQNYKDDRWANVHCFELVEPAKDSDIVFISSKEYNALLNRIKELEKQVSEQEDKWVSWNGGECPVGPETIVNVKFKDGVVEQYKRADNWIWKHNIVQALSNRIIIAYQILETNK